MLTGEYQIAKQPYKSSIQQGEYIREEKKTKTKKFLRF
jgi:hypothetical protein